METSRYVVDRDEYGHPRQSIDLPQFAADLCKAMGGTLPPVNPDRTSYDLARYQSFALDGCEIGLTRGWHRNEWNKITVCIAPPADAKLTYNQTPYGEGYKLPKATITATRPMDRIVADIKRRVIEPAKAPIAKRREHAEQLRQNANDLASTAARLRKSHPNLDIRVEQGATSSGSFFRQGEGPYLSGTFYADGSASINHIGSLTRKQFERLMRALYAEGN